MKSTTAVAAAEDSRDYLYYAKSYKMMNYSNFSDIFELSLNQRPKK